MQRRNSDTRKSGGVPGGLSKRVETTSAVAIRAALSSIAVDQTSKRRQIRHPAGRVLDCGAFDLSSNAVDRTLKSRQVRHLDTCTLGHHISPAPNAERRVLLQCLWRKFEPRPCSSRSVKRAAVLRHLSLLHHAREVEGVPEGTQGSRFFESTVDTCTRTGHYEEILPQGSWSSLLPQRHSCIHIEHLAG